MSLQNQQAKEPCGLWKIEAISVVQEQETIYNIYCNKKFPLIKYTINRLLFMKKKEYEFSDALIIQNS